MFEPPTIVAIALLFLISIAEFIVLYFKVQTIQSFVLGTIMVLVINIAASIIAMSALFDWTIALGTLAIFAASTVFPVLALIMKLLQLPDELAVKRIFDETISDLNSTINQLKVR